MRGPSGNLRSTKGGARAGFSGGRSCGLHTRRRHEEARGRAEGFVRGGGWRADTVSTVGRCRRTGQTSPWPDDPSAHQRRPCGGPHFEDGRPCGSPSVTRRCVLGGADEFARPEIGVQRGSTRRRGSATPAPSRAGRPLGGRLDPPIPRQGAPSDPATFAPKSKDSSSSNASARSTGSRRGRTNAWADSTGSLTRRRGRTTSPASGTG